MKRQAPVDKALEVLSGLGLAHTFGSSQPLPSPHTLYVLCSHPALNAPLSPPFMIPR